MHLVQLLDRFQHIIVHIVTHLFLPHRAMAAAASWVFDTGVQNHRADVLECPPAELAGEIAGN